MEKLDYKYKIAILVVVILLINIFLLKSALIGLVFGLIYLFFFGYLCGNAVNPSRTFGEKLFIGITTIAIVFTLYSSALFYLSSLKLSYIIPFFVIVSLIILHLIPKIKKIKLPKIQKPNRFKESKLTFALVAIYLIIFTSILVILQYSSTTEAIRSTWNAIPITFFVLYAINTVTLFTLCYTAKQNFFKYIGTSLHFFITIGIAIYIYPLGFGFDSIIHQATEKIIFLTGTLSPKPFYYAGHYSIVVFLSHLFQISVELIDTYLLPVILSLAVPASMLIFSKQSKEKRNIIYILPIILLMLPFTKLIVTTPQAMANLLLIIFIFWTVSSRQKLNLTKFYFLFMLGFGLAIFLFHPLTGLCAFIFIALILLTAAKIKKALKIPLIILFSIISTIIVPLAFYSSAFFSSQININLKNGMSHLTTLYRYQIMDGEILLNLAYMYKHILVPIFIFFAIIGIIILYRRKMKIIFLLPLIAVIVFINGLITKLFLDFSFLIDYERGDYAERLMEISLFFLIPAFLMTWHYIFAKFYKSKQFTFWLFIFISTLITLNVYLSYPHHDHYETSSLYNISKSDIKAVSFIQKHCANCVVLSNQAVSTAAIKAFGFSKNFQTEKGEIFYYPIPTGGHLYQYYLQMIKSPQPETIKGARDLTGAKTSFFVVNEYWWNSKKIIDEAKKTANAWIKIDNGKIFIFEYK